MGKNGKYFCMSVASLLIYIGTFMTLSSALAIVFNVLNFRESLNELEKHRGLGYWVRYVSMYTSVVYAVSVVLHCSLCCKCNYKNVKRFFTYYSTSLSVSAVAALLDGYFKLEIIPLISMFFFLYFLINIVSLIAAIMARHELLLKQQRKLNLFNTGNVNEEVPSGHDGFPKFAMAVNVEKIESRIVTETEPLNRI